MWLLHVYLSWEVEPALSCLARGCASCTGVDTFLLPLHAVRRAGWAGSAWLIEWDGMIGRGRRCVALCSFTSSGHYYACIYDGILHCDDMIWSAFLFEPHWQVQAHTAGAMVDENNWVFSLPHRLIWEICNTPIFIFMKETGWVVNLIVLSSASQFVTE
jgi:hypothetical protein